MVPSSRAWPHRRRFAPFGVRVDKQLLGLIMLQPPRRAQRQGKFHAHAHGSVCRLETSQPEDQATILHAPAYGEVARCRRGEVGWRAGFGNPGGIGGGQGLGAFEEGRSFGEGLAEEEELCGDEGCGREGGRWGWGDWCGGDWRGGVGYGEGEELDGVVEESVEVRERGEVDG